jgi:hypothetical protein
MLGPSSALRRRAPAAAVRRTSRPDAGRRSICGGTPLILRPTSSCTVVRALATANAPFGLADEQDLDGDSRERRRSQTAPPSAVTPGVSSDGAAANLGRPSSLEPRRLVAGDGDTASVVLPDAGTTGPVPPFGLTRSR